MIVLGIDTAASGVGGFPCSANMTVMLQQGTQISQSKLGSKGGDIMPLQSH